MRCYNRERRHGPVVELADTRHLKCLAARRAGSSPAGATGQSPNNSDAKAWRKDQPPITDRGRRLANSPREGGASFPTRPAGIAKAGTATGPGHSNRWHDNCARTGIRWAAQPSRCPCRRRTAHCLSQAANGVSTHTLHRPSGHRRGPAIARSSRALLRQVGSGPESRRRTVPARRDA